MSQSGLCDLNPDRSIMKTIVYFLGAGFSVPAGLPVISNFLFKAKDQLAQDPEKYKHFAEVFQYIDSLSKAKNFTNIDLYNIEEIFSIADTHELLGHKHKENLEQFIKDVIEYHTPKFSSQLGSTDIVGQVNVHGLFGSSERCRHYVLFVSSLLNVCLSGTPNATGDLLVNEVTAEKCQSDHCYKVITLNYDTIIEDALKLLNSYGNGHLTIDLAKLHGSVDKTIIPPTWNKQLGGEINTQWTNAAKWLKDATEIRILGYSMPQTDVYIKHLFGTALMESLNLQQIDVLCLDPDGTVSERYNHMFTFPRYKFYNVDLTEYINAFSVSGQKRPPQLKTNPVVCEDRHANMIRVYKERGVSSS